MGSRLEKGADRTRRTIEDHTFNNEEGDEYEGSKFGGFSDYFRRKKLKLQNLDAELRSSSENPLIFKGVVAHVNGYTQPSLNDLHRMIVSYGGGFLQYLDGKTMATHIVAANLTPKKAIEFKRYRIVKPAWVVDSIEAGNVLPWENYRVIDEGANQRLLKFNDGKIVSQANTQQKGYREQTNSSWYTSQVKRVAEDIDHVHGSKLPSPRVFAANRAGTHVSNSALPDQHRAMVPGYYDEFEDGPKPSNPESFGISSSLEDALNGADSSKPVREQSMESLAGPNIAARKTGEVKLESTHVETEIFSRSPNHSLPINSSSPAKKTRVMTAEEHNVLLLADPNIRKSSTANPQFLKQFYSESRLHHLSAWKADLKAQLQQMAAEKSLSQMSPKRKPGSRRYVMHVDFDSFFCAVSLKNAVESADKPAVVAHGQGSGSEIASCNYPARVFGIKNGMWMKKALELCPDIKVLPYDFPAYEEVSKSFYEAILNIGGIVQSVSVDEALVDISSQCISTGGDRDAVGISEDTIWREQEKANEIGHKLRDIVKQKTGCSVSIGLGSNILLAKVALRKAKPDGQYMIKPEEALDTIGDLTVRDLPGVAYSIGGKLEELGVNFVKDVRTLTKERFMTVLGPKTGEKIWDYSRGIDKTEVGEQVVRKSVSAEINWGIRFISQPEAERFVQNLCGELQKRMLEASVNGRQLTMKIMRRAADAPMDPPKHLGHGRCDTFNKSVTMGIATNSSDIIGREAISILRSYGFSPGELRGLGVQMTKLDPIRPKIDGRLNGSQRRITFNTTSAEPNAFKEEVENIDDPDSPHKSKATLYHPVCAIARANEIDIRSKRPLNLTGTQFIIPTQFDPKVLAELPHDIRSKLLVQSRSTSTSRSQSPAVKSRSHGPALQPEAHSPSEIDSEIFSALPEDVRAEVLASYSSKSTSSRAQSALHQSPQKVRILPLSKKSTTPTKKRSGLLFRGRNTEIDAHSTLTQSNFVTGKTAAASKEARADSDRAESDLDPEFLAALPEDVRAEVVAEHRLSRLTHRAGLGLSAKPIKKRPLQDVSSLGQKKLRLPPRLSKPTFTTNDLSSLPELRETLSRWHREFSSEGPLAEDVSAMGRYLRRVVCGERDVSKAVKVCGWLGWLIDENKEKSTEEGRTGWKQALEEMKDEVQEAVQERGRGRVEF